MAEAQYPQDTLEQLPDHEIVPISKIYGARILSHEWPSEHLYDIEIERSKISGIRRHDPTIATDLVQEFHETGKPDSQVLDARGCLLGSSLCHAHVHLDKAFLLSDTKYADLEIRKGDFAEALALTSEAKSRFEGNDLLRRGSWLIEESIAAGVTCMRVFVEVDATVELKCFFAAKELKSFYHDLCYLQICIFAQDPIFSGAKASENRDLISSAVRDIDVEAVGTTPYVEDSDQHSAENITWAVSTTLRFGIHLDLHLDYNLDPQKKSWIPEVVHCAKALSWPNRPGSKRIALGHCTRMTLYTHDELVELRDWAHNLPLSFIGLPTSDIFMMGRPESASTKDRVRGTLQVPHLIADYNMSAAISINNVGNAFTPYGSCDPLAVASMGVGLYQAGTKQYAQILYECVSKRAREVIGYGKDGEPFRVGQPADFVLFGIPGGAKGRTRGRASVQEVVYDPPKERRTIYKGNLVEI